jgi:hypothetical protein
MLTWLVNRGEEVASSSAGVSCQGIENSEQNTKDDEYERLVMPTQQAASDVNATTLPEQPRSRSFIWWMKVLLGCFLVILVGYVFVKWGIPFAFEKVNAATHWFLLLFHTVFSSLEGLIAWIDESDHLNAIVISFLKHNKDN